MLVDAPPLTVVEDEPELVVVDDDPLPPQAATIITTAPTTARRVIMSIEWRIHPKLYVRKAADYSSCNAGTARSQRLAAGSNYSARGPAARTDSGKVDANSAKFRWNIVASLRA